MGPHGHTHTEQGVGSVRPDQVLEVPSLRRVRRLATMGQQQGRRGPPEARHHLQVLHAPADQGGAEVAGLDPKFAGEEAGHHQCETGQGREDRLPEAAAALPDVLPRVPAEAEGQGAPQCLWEPREGQYYSSRYAVSINRRFLRRFFGFQILLNHLRSIALHLSRGWYCRLWAHEKI